MPDIIKFILVILVILIIYQLWMIGLSTLTQKAVAKRIRSQKVSDDQLSRLYQSVKKANRHNTLKAILMYGVFYRSPAKQNDKLLAVYQAEMERRQLI